MSLARLWCDQGKVREERELLAPVYRWFTEGFDTRDLKDAHVLAQVAREVAYERANAPSKPRQKGGFSPEIVAHSFKHSLGPRIADHAHSGGHPRRRCLAGSNPASGRTGKALTFTLARIQIGNSRGSALPH
jgi:hypothetical protein